ncbi:MAG TPA: SDR family NAD(P)-dependent oxidoreductase [Terriglobales bacterium]|jgi:uncharacterized oxidoreductase
MRLSGNTILITGGTSGIGFELASQLLKCGNTVIITGRSQRKLDDAREKLPGIHALQSDVSDPEAIRRLFDVVVKEFPKLNILVNNAGIMREINLQNAQRVPEDIGREIEINLIGPVRMVVTFLPQLKAQENAAIVNVSSGLAFVPLPIAPIYSATKAGVHSFTQSLRVQLKNTGIKVFELAPPFTRTSLFATDFHTEDVRTVRMMDVVKMVGVALEGLKKDRLEIRPGPSNILKLMSRLAPQFILNRLSRPVDAMLSRTASR